MFRSNSISAILLALAICAASPTWCFAQAKVARRPMRTFDWLFSRSPPLLPALKATDKSSGDELPNPFDPFPDASEVAELDSILAVWDRVFAEEPFNTRKFRRWNYDKIFGPEDPEQCKDYREGVITRATPFRWSMRETVALGNAQVSSEWDDLVLIPNFFGPRSKPSKMPDPSHIPTESWAWDEESIAFWGSYNSEPSIGRVNSAQYDPPLFAALAFCGNGYAGELARRYWMRVVSRESADEQPRIELRPRMEIEARSWQMITILLGEDQLPHAIEIVEDKNCRQVFELRARTNAWWPDTSRFSEMARFRHRADEYEKPPNVPPPQ